jgi:hypothetical protein
MSVGKFVANLFIMLTPYTSEKEKIDWKVDQIGLPWHHFGVKLTFWSVSNLPDAMVIHFPHPFHFILLISLLHDLILLKAPPNIERSSIRLSFKVVEAHWWAPLLASPNTKVRHKCLIWSFGSSWNSIPKKYKGKQGILDLHLWLLGENKVIFF